MRPEESGALLARDTPKHKGRATKNTTNEDLRSYFQEVEFI
jgi:hypothetical protein